MNNQPRKPKKLSANLTALSLNIATPEQTDMTIPTAPSSQGGLLMSIPVHEIDFFDKNPRQHHEAESYQHIKESIRSLGVLQPVHITQRPNETRYILAQGGNTRLKIMRELFDETGDERFRFMPCLYQPYRDDTILQIAHLIENEQRADMCFWDKAHAYAQIRTLLLDNKEHQPSLREMEQLFALKGLSISHAALSLFFFTHDHLSELGQLGVGLSHPKVVELKKYHARLFQAAKSTSQPENFPDFWADSLRQFSSQNATTEWDITALLSFLEDRFKQIFDVPLSDDSENKTAPVKNNIKADSALIGAQPNDASHAVTAKLATEQVSVSVPTPTGTAQQGVDPLVETQSPTVSEPAQTKSQLQKKLHSVVRRMLAAVNLQTCFVLNEKFHYGFFIDYPPFEHLNSNAQCIFAVDMLHPDAGDVFVYLSKLSKQHYWLHHADKSAKNPIYALPNSSKLRIACYDAEKLEEYNDMGIGERQSLVEKIITWHIDPNHSLHSFVFDLNSIVCEINKLDSLGGHDE